MKIKTDNITTMTISNHPICGIPDYFFSEFVSSLDESLDIELV